MTFHELSLYFQKLEQTASRNSMTEILADLFRHATEREIGNICYLLEGRVVPLYEPVEFGIADQFMMRAIARAYNTSEEMVKKTFKRLGDLGQAAEALHTGGTDSRLSVIEIFTKLDALARVGGEGSQETKIAALSNILSHVDPLSARYIVRIPLDKLRLGFSDMTILDALSWMETGDKSLRVRLEEAYNVRTDIGFIAETVKKHGVRGLSQVKIKLGTPVLPALCQRLPTADEMIKKMGEVAVEPKYDGVRCVGGYAGLFLQGRGYISARDVHKGDSVLTHKGRFRKILAVAKRHPRKGEVIYRLQTMLGDSCLVSGDHPVLRQREKNSEWVAVRELSSTDWLLFPKITSTIQKIASRLVLKDTAGYSKSIILNEKFFRFLGFWVGDGFSNNSHQSERVGITFNAKTEKELANEYEQIIAQMLHIKEISRYEHNGGLNLYWRDSMFRTWLTKEFRYQEKNGEHGKCIPDWMFGITRQHFLAFMRGWDEADGTTRHGDGRRITTRERRLALKAVLLGSLFQYPIGVRKTRVALRNKVSKTYYELLIPGTNRYVKEVSGMYALKIRVIEKTKVHPRVFLYDFQVEDDESFCTSLMVMHNCQVHYKREGGGRKEEVRSFSRNLENTTAMFPELGEIGSELAASEAILDSEAVGFDGETQKLIQFQNTMTRKRKHDIETARKSVPLKFFVFDILYKDGKELLSTEFSTRRNILEATIRNSKYLMISPQIVTSDADRIRSYHDEQIAQGLEGAVVKKWRSPYEPGRRGYSWVKFKEEEGKTGKLRDTIDAVVMGYTSGEGKRTEFGLGQMILGVKDGDEFVTVTKLGSGATEAELGSLFHTLKKLEVREKPKEYRNVHKTYAPDYWVTPKLVLEIAGDDLTKSKTHGAGYAVRFPRLVRIREDKSHREATTVAEVIHMYETQGNGTRT